MATLESLTRRIAYTLACESDEALDLLELVDRSAPHDGFVEVRVDDLDAAVRSLVRLLHARERAAGASAATRRLAQLSDDLDPNGVSPEAFAALIADRAERIRLLAQIGELDAAAAAANQGLAWVGDERLGQVPTDVLVLDLRGDLLWTAGQAFGDPAILVKAMTATTAALTLSADFPETSRSRIRDPLALKLAERALILVDAGSDSELHLAQARAALDRLSDAGCHAPPALSLELRWGLASGEDRHAAEVLRTAATAAVVGELGVPPHRLAAVELLARCPSAEAWRRELGPFAAPLYAEARGVTVAEAYAWLGEASAVADGDGTAWPPRALTIRRLVLTDADVDLEAMARHQEVRSAAPDVRAVPTASLRAYLEASSADPGLAPWMSAGAQAARAGEDIHHQVTAMLAYFDRHRTATEASFACAAVLAGVVTALLTPGARAAYAGHLLRYDHDVAFERARHP